MFYHKYESKRNREGYNKAICSFSSIINEPIEKALQHKYHLLR